MQQRRRPSGTDGSDFSYRMVVDPRYTNVTKGKSRLKALIIIQAFAQLVAVPHILLVLLKEEDFDKLSIISVIHGFFSLLIGELGRRRSQTSLLRLYMVASSTVTFLSMTSIVKNNDHLKVIHEQSSWEMRSSVLFENGRLVFGFIVQIFAVLTTTSLIENMAPAKRAS
ncbi:hypothetical protein GIB67_008743 [Kingdonia uniflora]|uniref:Uncharacterized protein n=1 Tax=Kingdonia uniflora TaxID=39325 RepID=A0A7J7P687_9MAGN|nr:hypothetical protein GIB67_008743 [Kingdonia uniflora]